MPVWWAKVYRWFGGVCALDECADQTVAEEATAWWVRRWRGLMAARSASRVRDVRMVEKPGWWAVLGQMCMRNLASSSRLRILWEMCWLVASRVRESSSWEQLQWRWKECPSVGVGVVQNGQVRMRVVMFGRR